MEKEIWKDVIGYKGLYMVSNLGRVKSLDRAIVSSNKVRRKVKGTILKPAYTSGYAVVSLCSKKQTTKKVHRLVGLAFISNPKKYRVLNHISGTKKDNSVANLEWCTYSYNTKHAIKLGLCKPPFNEKNGKLKERQVLEIVKLLNKKVKQYKIAKQYNVSNSTIGGIKRGERWNHLTKIKKAAK